MRILLFILFASALACQSPVEKPLAPVNVAKEKPAIDSMLNAFNIAAAKADFDGYFRFYTHDATFNGTDATENWDKPAFQAWAKPYFDAKTTWNFKSVQRRIYFGRHPDIAWFEELLNTQMKICRGSGVVVKQGDQWKVQQYVLSATIPNPIIDTVTAMKTPIEDALLKVLAK